MPAAGIIIVDKDGKTSYNAIRQQGSVRWTHAPFFMRFVPAHHTKQT